MVPQTNKLRDVVSFFKKELESYYPENELKVISEIIFEGLFDITKQEMMLFPENLLNESQIVKLLKVIKRLKRYEPVQYVAGYTDFLELKINIKPPVLIPRPETEELVLWVEEELKSRSGEKINLLDVCSGSGCIALVLKRRLPEISVYGLDINPEAVSVAKANAQRFNLKIDFFQKDILKIKDDPLVKQKWDVWVSNPPYVRLSERKFMHDNVLKYEPREALFVDDNNPLLFYDNISSHAQKALKKDGLLFFEINEAMGQNVKRLLEEKGFSDVIIKKDINDKDRFVMAKKANSI